MTPHKLGRYEIVRVLGKGAMGIVYEGRDPNLDRRVAIKTVKVENLGAETAAEYEARFRTEARSAGRLQHPNIVSVYDAARDGDTAYLVMEFVHGEDLKSHIDKGRRYSLDETARIIFDLLAALGMAHQHNIVHRDIKPANLLIEKGGRMKLTDFGVARIQNSGEATRTRGGVIGTLKYMAPEQVQGLSVDARADLFSAGVVLYQLLTDRRPFDADTDFAIMHQVVHVMPEQPSHWHPGLTPGIDAVVRKALAKNRDERFQTAEEFDQALREALREVPDTTIVPPANPLKVFAAEQAGLVTGDSRMGGGTTGATATHSVLPSGASGPSSVTQELELVYWKDVRDSTDPDELLGFLAKFPTGIYADLAKKRLKRLTEPQADEATRLASAGSLSGIAAAKAAAASDASVPAAAPGGDSAATSAKDPNTKPSDPRDSVTPSPDKDSGFATTLQVAPTAQELAGLGVPPSSASPAPVAAPPATSSSVAPSVATSAQKSDLPTSAQKPEDKPVVAAQAPPAVPARQPEAVGALWLNTSLYAPESELAVDAAKDSKPVTPPAPISPTAESSGQLRSESGARAGMRPPSRKSAALAGQATAKQSSKWKLWLGLCAALGAAALAWQLKGTGSSGDRIASAPAKGASQADLVASAASAMASDPALAAASAATPASGMATSSPSSSPSLALTASPTLAGASAADAVAAAASAASAASAAARAAAASAARAREAARKASAMAAPVQQPVDVSVDTASEPPPAPAPTPAPAVAAPVPRAIASKPPAEGTADPKQSCEGRVLLAYFACITDRCQRPQYARHPTCVEWREAEARRRREAETR